ncbi:hypothetical protein [Cryptosporangium aurantiacum]|uniref:Transcriptional regulator n=1 Tax=Cryptosporangium aurantiacum TaxID=134849 RepID=A0A1M7PPL1_9ACTN|nr:hypothetical protein [Cryptosporangium aurantiacum]SHN19279.1 hypothetical protein SAMN05443668_103561 [Cryptosporangium aurantiacum]
MVESRNARLAARMADLGLTREGLAREVNRVVAGTRSPIAAVATERWVYLLLSGRTRWPRAHYRAALEEIFGCTALDLGFIPPLGKPGACRRVPTRSKEVDVDRRRFLYLAGALGAATVTLPDVRTGARIGLADLERLRAPLHELCVFDQQHGAANLVGAATQAGALVSDVLRHGTMSGRVRRSAYTLQGEYMTAAAWFSLDSDNLPSAGRYLDRALTVAAMAQDPLLQGDIWNLMAYRASEAGNWNEVLTIAQAGLASTGARREPRIAAIMHGWAAKSYAAQGYQGWSTRAIGRAHDAVNKVTQPPAAEWLTFVDHSEVDAFASNAARRMGRYREADDLAQRAALATPPGRDRNRISRTLMSVQARLGLGEVDGAAEAAETPLQKLPALRSDRLLRRMHDVRKEFAAWREVSSARDWVDRFDATTAA